MIYLFLKKKEINTSQILIAKKGNVLIGFIQLERINNKTIKIRRLAVRQKYRDNNIGRKLVGVARSIAIKENKKIVTSSRTNYSTLRFWKKHAKFKPVELPQETEFDYFNMARDFELTPEPKPRIRKPKRVLKFLNFVSKRPK